MGLRLGVRSLDRLQQRAQSGATLAKAKRRAAAVHLARVQEVFASEGRPLAQWPQLAKPSGGDRTPRLQDTGALVQSLTYEVTSTGYRLGTSVPYAAVHQFGATIPISPAMRRVLRGMGYRPRNATLTVTIPARPFLGLAPEWESEIADAYLSALTEDDDGV